MSNGHPGRRFARTPSPSEETHLNRLALHLAAAAKALRVIRVELRAGRCYDRLRDQLDQLFLSAAHARSRYYILCAAPRDEAEDDDEGAAL